MFQKARELFPLLVLNHGYIDPEIYTNGRGLRREQDYLARRGYVVMHIDYRNHAESDKDPQNDLELRLGYAEDAINAVLAVKNSGLDFIDAEKVGMLGHSMGGGVTLNAMVIRPEIVSAAVLFAPVSGDQRKNFDEWVRERTDLAAMILDHYGTFDEDPEFWDNASAKSFYDRFTAPVQIHHGTEDESVPLAWSEELQADLQTAGRDSALYVYDGEPHEFIGDWPLVMQRTVEFFDQYVKGKVND